MGQHRYLDRLSDNRRTDRPYRRRSAIGVQIIGGYLEDRTTIAFAGLIEREFGGFTPPPI